MWPDWIPTAVAVAIIGGVIAIYGHRQNRKTATETNKLNASDQFQKNQADEIKRQDGRLDRLERIVEEQGQKIKHLEQRDWSWRRYVTILIDRLRALGDDNPPEPPTGIEI